jgi:hypothetical protein
MEQTICREFVEKQLEWLVELRSQDRVFQNDESPFSLRKLYPLTPLALALVKAIENHLSLPPMGCVIMTEEMTSFLSSVGIVLSVFKK